MTSTQSFKEIQNAPMRQLRDVDLKLALSRLIRDRQGLVGCHVVGTQQSGKSSYGLLVMYELYRGDLDEMFKHVVFSIQSLTELLNTAIKNRERMICVMWDDSSVQGSAGMYNVNRRMVQYLSAMGDTLGIATKGIILTSPSGDIVKAFRNYNFYKAQIGFGRAKYDRIARGYEFGMSPFNQKWGRIAFEDHYDTRLPFYERYYTLREKLSLSVLADANSIFQAEPKAKFYSKGGKKYVEYTNTDSKPF